ncbi:hypothetical protein D9758_003782 [Tetrapyrgos nigripes]|uniref:Zn(2)-C6 fungal-type domain-containing protein n=1 Tax=Tetrapyrgos nigripes TaxID=182062 RepID=A0A8H5GMP1_9AGAR|nr:hypothetical protein D9758_003782 [Tetrapyrgos nigripes]
MSNHFQQWNTQYHPQPEHTYPSYDQTSNDYSYPSEPSQSSLYASGTRSDPYMQNPNYQQPQQQQHPTLPTSYNFQPELFRDPNRILPSSSSGQVHHPTTSYIPSSSSTAKRQRVHEPVDDTKDEDVDTDAIPEQKEGNKGKPGACARCKSLKVRCEFKTDTDPCKRCLNGGHECVIPGRKKRRTPPKREHLLAQIQKQAEEIEKLMAKLVATEASNRDSRRTSTEDLCETVSPDFLSSTASQGTLTVPSSANKAVEDWFAKARDSLTEFGGFIGMGGASLPKSYIVDPDLEDSSDVEDSDEYSDARSDFEDNNYVISTVESDAEEVESGRRGRGTSVSSSGSGQRAKLKGAKKGGGRMATLPSEAAPFGLMAGLSLRNKKRSDAGSDVGQEEAAEGENGLGVANADFFRSPTPDPKSTSIDAVPQAPHILARGIITPEEIEPLFKIFFDLINPSISLVDPVLYTPERTVYRSPFLFTVICAVSSRFYTERPGIYMQAMHYAQFAAGSALIGGPKNVEMVMAYIILSLYQLPFKRWEDSRGWLYLGLAIRIATELNLHHPVTAKPQNEFHAREMLNRTRVWLNCFNLDRSTGSQYGKAPIIPDTDYLANHSEDWWHSSPWNMKNFDVHLICYQNELRVMAGFVKKIYSNPEHPTGLNKEVDFERLAAETDEELQQLEERWFPILDKNVDPNDRQGLLRTGLLKLAFSYARLIALSYGFQHAFGKNNFNENPFLMRCKTAAFDVVKAMVENLAQPELRIYIRHGPEAQSVFTTFAAAFLVKLLQPKFSSYLDDHTRQEIRNHVQSVIDLFSSPDIALDNRHGPKLYARFLKGLLASPMVTGVPRRKTHHPLSSSMSSSSSGRQSGPHNHLNGLSADHPSPASSHSLSPPPSHEAMSFDHFAPTSQGAIDPFQTSMGVDPSHSSALPQDDFGMGQTDYNPYQQQGLPLPDGDDLLRMHSISDPANWQGMAVPSYNWLGQFQNEMRFNMYGQNAQYMAM